MVFVRTKTLGECWKQSVIEVMSCGFKEFDEDVEIREVLGLSLHIENPLSSDPLITQVGSQNVINKMLKKFSKGVVMADQPFTYGELLYSHGGIDQFEWMVERIQSKPETKSATISLLTPGSKSLNLPCLNTLDAKVRNGQLHLQFFFRSQNIFGRQYANLLALASLHENLARRCDCTVGSMMGYVASAHIYSYDYDDAIKLSSGIDIKIDDRFYSHGPSSIRGSSIKLGVEC